MSRMTSLDKLLQIRKGLGSPSTGDVPDAEIGQYLWMAEMQLAGEHDFPALRIYEDVSTIASTVDIEMATDEDDVLRFLTPGLNTTNNSFPMEMKDDEWYRQRGVRFSGGEPLFWFPHGIGASGGYNIRFSPTPSGVYVCRIPYIKVPTAPDMTDGTISDLPISHDHIVAGLAVEIASQFVGERGEAKKQRDLNALTEYRAGKTLPAVITHVKKFGSFKDLVRRR